MTIVVIGLLHFLVVPLFATSCVVSTPEQELQQSREGAINFLYKGLFLGLILAAYLGNMALYFMRTRRWFYQVVFVALSIPIAFIYAIWEAANSGCGFGGLPAFNYIVILLPLVVALVLQGILASRSIHVNRPHLS